MMKRLKIAVAALFLTGGLAVASLGPAHTVSALDCGGADSSSPTCQAKQGVNDSGGGGQSLKGYIQNIINILLFIIGIIAVIVIVIAGIQYATSGGNPDQASRAKNAIIYAVIGIIVAVMAYAIVGFVIGNI